MKTIIGIGTIIGYLVTLILLIGCSSIENVNQININNKCIEYVLEGEGFPTLVFETGMGPTMNTWDTILDSLAQHSRIYAYNRPGYGNSSIDSPPGNPIEVATQLHQNLKAQHILPPYILIGHSAGGLYINMFARLFPQEVSGVVFIDASHPEQFEYFKTNRPIIYNLLIAATKKGEAKYEYDIVRNTKQSFIDAPTFPQIPITVLTAGKSSPFENKELRSKWISFQNDLANLSVISKHVIVENSGHYIHRNEPDLVISEILAIINTIQ